MLWLKNGVTHAQKDLDEDYWEKKKNKDTAGTKIRAHKKPGRPQALSGIIVASLHRLNNIDDVRRVNESISRLDMGSKLFSSI